MARLASAALLVAVSALFLAGRADGLPVTEPITFSDKAEFLAATQATPEEPLPNLGLIPGGSAAQQTVGDLTFSILSDAAGNELFIGSASEPALAGAPWTTRLPGNQIAISGLENLNIDLAAHVFAFGFDFVEPETDPFIHGLFIDSTFAVTLLNAVAVVGAFNFEVPNDMAAFVGVWSRRPFDRVEIREVVGDTGNEFFGQFYASTRPLPQPASFMLLSAGLVILVGATHGRRLTLAWLRRSRRP